MGFFEIASLVGVVVLAFGAGVYWQRRYSTKLETLLLKTYKTRDAIREAAREVKSTW